MFNEWQSGKLPVPHIYAPEFSLPFIHLAHHSDQKHPGPPVLLGCWIFTLKPSVLERHYDVIKISKTVQCMLVIPACERPAWSTLSDPVSQTNP